MRGDILLKFLSMHMPAFGPFTEFELNFGSPGLQVVYGPNESGKSSSLRAFRALLYGMHRQTSDNFLHPYNMLAVRASLQHSDGRVMEVVRRKGRKDTLKTLEGDTVADSEFTGFIGNLTEEVFDRLYGLDHRTLASGGKALLAEGGKVGESLFAANVGPAFRQVRENLRKEAEELWKPRGQKQALNATLSAWKQARKEARDASLQVSKFESLQNELEQQQSEVHHLQEQLGSVRARLQTLENQKSALPRWARYRELGQALEEQSGLPELGLDFSQRREKTRVDYDQAMADLRRLKAEQSQLEERLKELPTKWPVLDLAEGVEKLYQRASRVEDIQTEIPALEAELRQLQDQIEAVRSSLGLSEGAESFPASSVRAEARQLAGEHQDIQTQLESIAESRARLEGRLKRLETQKTELKETGDLADLELMLGRARVGANWEERLHQMRAEYKTARASLDSELQALPFWNRDIESLKSLAVPSADCVDRMDREIQEAQSAVLQTQRAEEQAQGRLKVVQKELSRLEAGGPIPTPEQLQELRRDRDRRFEQLVLTWQSGGSGSEGQVAEFRHSLKEVDTHADRILKDADRVAARAEQQRQADALAADLEQRRSERIEAEQALQKVNEAWAALWIEALPNPQPPREMRRWLELRLNVLARQREFENVHQEGLSLDKKRQELLDGLRKALLNAFPSLELPLDDLGQTLHFVEKKLSQAKEASGRLASLNQSFVEIERERDDLDSKEQHFKQRLKDWEPRWSDTISQFSLAKEPTPKALDATLAEYDQLQHLHSKAHSCRQELEKLQAESRVFEMQVKEVASLVEGSEAKTPWLTARNLHSLLVKAREQQKALATMNARLDELNQAREEAKFRLTQASEEVAKLLSEAAASDMDELPSIETQVRKRRELLTLQNEVSETLLSLGGGATLEEFCQTLSDLSAEQVEAELEELSQRQTELETSQRTLLQRIGELKEKLQQMDGSDQAARAAERAAQLQTEGLELTAQFMRLELAEHVLKTEIENYRRANEGPILKKSSEYFAKLTCGDYTELHSGYDDDSDEPVLQAIARSGRRVNVEGMSEGTRDQLFLSLRLATIDLRAEHAEPFPLIADDLLVQFDRERALATLNVLAEFARRHQVLLFTHLDRDRELAEKLDSELAEVKSLERLSL